MNIKKPKISTGHKLRVPKRKKIQMRALGQKDRKKFNSKTTIPSKPPIKKYLKKKSTAKTIASAKTITSIKNEIIKEKKLQRKNLSMMRQRIQKMEESSISFNGLEEISKPSITKIQNKRIRAATECQDLIKEITRSAKVLIKLEKEYQAKFQK